MDQIIDEGVKLVFAIAAPVIAALVSIALARVISKLGLQIGAETQARLEAYARLAVQQTEEWAAARLKAKIPTASYDKLNNAITFVLDRVPGVTYEEAAAVVQAKLPELGYGASSFLRAVRQAATTEQPAQ